LAHLQAGHAQAVAVDVAHELRHGCTRVGHRQRHAGGVRRHRLARDHAFKQTRDGGDVVATLGLQLAAESVIGWRLNQ